MPAATRFTLLGTLDSVNIATAERPWRMLATVSWVAILQRTGEARWRLVLPWPNTESNLDLIELVPAPRG